MRKGRASDPQRAEDPREGNGRRSLNVVVEATHTLAVALEEADRVRARPVLELDERAGELGLDRRDELVHECIELVVGNAGLLEPEIQRVREQALVVRPDVDQHGQRVLRRNAARRGVERQLPDRDPHAVRAEVTETEDALATCDHDAADVALRPVADDLAKTALPFDGEVEAARPAEEVAELLAGLADRRRVDDRHEPRRIGHEDAIEERFVRVLQLREIDVALEVGRLAVELREGSPQLRVEIVDTLGKKTEEAKGLTLLLAECRRLVEARVMKKIGPARRRHPRRRISAWTRSSSSRP